MEWQTIEHRRDAVHLTDCDLCQNVVAGRSTFPNGTVAYIFKRGRSAMTSGRARTKNWLLTFEPRMAPYIETLDGLDRQR